MEIVEHEGSVSVSEGKERLSHAIRNENVQGIKDALVYLSKTSLAWSVNEEGRKIEPEDDGMDCQENDTRTKLWRKHVRVSVDYNVGLPPHHAIEFQKTFGYGCGDSDDDNNNDNDDNDDGQGSAKNRALHACIGPNPIHTEMVGCLLTPHILHNNSKDGSETIVVIGTNANQQKVLESSHDLGPRPTTPLELACHYGNIDLVRLLLEHGADPNNGRKPLAVVCQQGHLELARLLLEYGADPNACVNDGLTPLIRAARAGNLDMVKLLLTPPIVVGSSSSSSSSSGSSNTGEENSLSHTNQSKNENENQWGTNVYHYDQQSMNALMHACAENNEAVVRFLVSERGAARANNSSSSSSSSSSNNNNNKQQQQQKQHRMRIVKEYVNAYKVDPALWYASAHGSANIVKFLMDDCGATPDYRKDPTVYSSTPLEEACQWGHASTVRVLLERSGSDPRSRSGEKARTMAERSGHHTVVKLLDEWRGIYSDTIERGSFPLGLLPFLLCKKNDCAHRILCNHAGGIVGCYHNNNSGKKPMSSRHDNNS